MEMRLMSMAGPTLEETSPASPPDSDPIVVHAWPDRGPRENMKTVSL